MLSILPPCLSVANLYPLFLILCLVLATKAIYDETGWDTWSHDSWIKAQEKLHKKWQRREKIRQLKQKAEKQIDELFNKKKDKDDVGS